MPVLGLTVEGIAAVEPDDVWADISTLGGSTSTSKQGAFLLHWNGRAWARAAFPYVGVADSPVTTDGHGGVWVMLAGGNNEVWFCHYSAGHWTRTPVPGGAGGQAGAQNLAWIPGTRSQWAVGGANSASLDTAILKYGA